MKPQMLIYADNAATTRLSDAALAAMLPYLQEQYGNASTLYRLGRDARKALEDARGAIAACLGAGAGEIYFTSGGSEADNWALKGTLHRLAGQGKTHLVTSCIEHHAVLHSAQALQAEGFALTILPVRPDGQVDPDAVRAALRPETALVSVMYANNETGTLQPIREIGALCREAGVLFHTDAVQAAGTLPLDLRAEPIDLLSLSAHKFHGPKGVGALYCRRGAAPAVLLNGGAQERRRRAGTENVAGIVGMAAALQEACAGQAETTARLTQLRDQLRAGLLQIPGARLNGAAARCLPGIVNVSFEGVDGEALLYELDRRGVAASSGSACNAGSLTPSHVLLALGLPYALAHGSLRLSLGRCNTAEQVPQLIAAVAGAVQTLRAGPLSLN